jgi:hypothetical protein
MTSSQGAEVTRVVTGKSTIPAQDALTVSGVAFSGTLTTSGIPNVLEYTGGLTAQDVFGAQLQLAWSHGMYVWENTSTNGSVRKIAGVFTPDNGITWSILVDSAFSAPLVGEDLKIVTASLADYSVGNQGGADGIYDGVALGAGATIPRKENTNRRASTRNREVKAINATGTSFLIDENK